MEVRSRNSIKSCLALSVVFLFNFVLFFDTNSRPATAADAPAMQRSGAAVFAQMCARCHGSDGRAQTAKGRSVGATDLTSSAWVPDTARDTRIVTRGKESMPAFKGKLKPAEIEAVVNYIRRFKR